MREVWIEACELTEGDVIVGVLTPPVEVGYVFCEMGSGVNLAHALSDWCKNPRAAWTIDHALEGAEVLLVHPRIDAQGKMRFKTDMDSAAGMGKARRVATPNDWFLVEIDE